MNRVFINSYDQVEIIVDGDQTVASVDAMADKAEKLVKQLKKAGKPAVVLDNLLLIGKVPSDAQKKVIERGRNIDYDKLAFVSDNIALRVTANLMIKAIGKGNRVKYFEDYLAAVKWLNEMN